MPATTTRRGFMGTLLGTAALCQTATPQKPNIIFILADDLGIGDLGCYGADHFKTPNIDRLAREGTRYTHAYTAPLCGPSRALIMTGRYAFRTGATNQDATREIKPAAEVMMPQILKSAGYATAMAGKWGQLPLEPAEWGFEEHLKFQGSGTYWNTQDRGKTYLHNGISRKLEDKQYLPDLMHDFVADFMSRHRAKPFYVYYSLSHVHADILPTPDSSPADVNDSKALYRDNIQYMDKLVGKLMSELDRLKLRENTLVIFVGDNGTAEARADGSTIGGRRLSGAKGSMLEGGALVPLIANWKKTTPAGKVSPDLIDSTDFLPTFAELAGTPLPQGRVIDGRSFAPQLQSRKGQPREWIFIQLARQWYVRDAKWKLNQKGELFDMSKAPFEEPVVASAEHPARKRLQAALDQLNPAAGILDQGDGSGRHANRRNRKRN